MQTETLTASPVLEAGYNTWLERGLLPDWLIRIGIRRLVAARLRKEGQGSPAEQAERLPPTHNTTKCRRSFSVMCSDRR